MDNSIDENRSGRNDDAQHLLIIVSLGADREVIDVEIETRIWGAEDDVIEGVNAVDPDPEVGEATPCW